MNKLFTDLFLFPTTKTERKIKILLVESEVVTRQMWAEILSSSCEVYHASSVSEAITNIKSEAPDIVVLDWMIPDGPASTVLFYWMSNVGGPCCLVCNEIDAEMTVKFYRQGVMHVLLRPLDPGVFSAIMMQYRRIVQNDLNYKVLQARVDRLQRQIVGLIVAGIVTIILYLGGGVGLLQTIIKFFS